MKRCCRLVPLFSVLAFAGALVVTTRAADPAAVPVAPVEEKQATDTATDTAATPLEAAAAEKATEEADTAPAEKVLPKAAAGAKDPMRIREGIFYLTRPMSVQTEDGVVGLNPGTVVSQQPDGSYQAKGHKVELSPAQLTNDPLIAERAATADHADQTQIQQNSNAAATAAQEAESRAAAAKPVAPPKPKRANVRPVPPKSSQLEMSTGLKGGKIERSQGLGGKGK